MFRSSSNIGFIYGLVTAYFGIQLFRVFIGSLVGYLNESLQLGEVVIVLILLGILGTAFLVSFLLSRLDTKKAAILSGLSIGVFVLLIQVFNVAVLNFVFSSLGLVLFFSFLPTYFRASKENALSGSFGVLPGAFLLTALVASIFNYNDYLHSSSISALLATLLFVATQLVFGYALFRDKKETITTTVKNGFKAALLWVVLGAMFLVKTEFLFSIGRHILQLGKLSGFDEIVSYIGYGSFIPELAMLYLVLGVLVGLLVVSFEDKLYGLIKISQNSLSRYLFALIWAVFATVYLLFGGPILGFLGVVGTTYIVAKLSTVLVELNSLDEPPTFTNKGGGFLQMVGFSLGFFLSIVLILLYYFGYSINLGFDPFFLVLFPALILLLASVAVIGKRAFHTTKTRFPIHVGLSLSIVASLIFLSTLIASSFGEERTITPSSRFSAITYNIHFGWSTDSTSNLEDVAKVIEDRGADVVFLQEVTRGWTTGAAHDSLVWLARRLDMEHAFYAASSGDGFGNAILSKVAIDKDSVNVLYLPGEDATKRNLLSVSLKTGLNYSGRVIGEDGRLVEYTDEAFDATIGVVHLHHRDTEQDEAIRTAQTTAILESIDGFEKSVLLGGDFNAEDDKPTYDLVKEARFYDTQEVAGLSSLPTFKSGERIDYLFGRHGFGVLGITNGSIQVEPPGISDHGAVSAEFNVGTPPPIPG